MSALNLYNIPAGAPFAKTLATHIFNMAENTPHALSSIKVFLPTRRACRVLREAFLSLNKNTAIILPQLQPLGDIDEEELSLSAPFGELALSLPPSMPSLKRQMILAKLINANEKIEGGFDQALELAKALAHLIDQIHTENLDIKTLKTLVPTDIPDLAEHWEITLKFLEILSEAWPKILDEQGAIDTAKRRNQLILALNEQWQAAPPQTPIIAAGTTGSIPATAKLLKTIAAMPNGQVILPGLDEHMDKESWAALEEPHPQYGFKHLLSSWGLDYNAVKRLPGLELPPIAQARNVLASELMRPAETSKAWTNISPETHTHLHNAFENLSYYECRHEQEEAETIALLLREHLEDEQKTACLITPDRALAGRVQSAIKRWDIALDDSAGTPFSKTALGHFLSLIPRVCASQIAPHDILALAKNTYIKHEKIAALDLALRGAKPREGFDGLKTHIENREHFPEDLKQEAYNVLTYFKEHLTPLITLYAAGEPHDFATLLTTHIDIAEKLASLTNLWRGEIGQKASAFISDLLDQAHSMPKINSAEYADIIQNFIHGLTLRPSYGTHPRLHILGQLEARLIDADLVILAGLNEGTWPPDTGNDPWMSRPMRKAFGLPLQERNIGLSAHDFVQGLCAPNVILTRAEKQDNTPTIPARWLQRLSTVMQAAKLDQKLLRDHKALSWARTLDHSDPEPPINRPEPKPPAASRPKRLSVTEIETWLSDPYSIYAKHILGLKKIDDIEQNLDAAIKGTALHNVLETFMTEHPKDLPDNPYDSLMDIARDYVATRTEDESMWALWLSRFENVAQWFITHEEEWRQTNTHLKTEIKGEWDIDGLTLSGRMDRIDQGPLGAVLIDYKSSKGKLTPTALKAGELPQLPLGALMLQNGAFKGSTIKTIQTLEYWILNAGAQGSQTIPAETLDGEMLQHVEENFKTLITIFKDENTPYISLPRPDKTPAYNDYLHLARVQEWAVLGDDETESEAA